MTECRLATFQARVPDKTQKCGKGTLVPGNDCPLAGDADYAWNNQGDAISPDLE